MSVGSPGSRSLCRTEVNLLSAELPSPTKPLRLERTPRIRRPARCFPFSRHDRRRTPMWRNALRLLRPTGKAPSFQSSYGNASAVESSAQSSLVPFPPKCRPISASCQPLLGNTWVIASYLLGKRISSSSSDGTLIIDELPNVAHDALTMSGSYRLPREHLTASAGQRYPTRWLIYTWFPEQAYALPLR